MKKFMKEGVLVSSHDFMVSKLLMLHTHSPLNRNTWWAHYQLFIAVTRIHNRFKKTALKMACKGYPSMHYSGSGTPHSIIGNIGHFHLVSCWVFSCLFAQTDPRETLTINRVFLGILVKIAMPRKTCIKGYAMALQKVCSAPFAV